MRTLVLLTALLLLALQAQAETLSEEVEEESFLEQSREEETIAVSLTGTKGFPVQKSGMRKVLNCRCRQRACSSRRQMFGICRQGHKNFVFCCR